MNRRPHPRGGFTLVEVLAVILIIGILSAFLVTKLGGAEDATKSQNSRGFIAQLAAAVEEYESQKGDYPPSTFPKDLDPRPTKGNMGAEMLVIALYPADGSFRGLELPDDRLGNTDADDTKRSLTSFSSPEVFEFTDDWGNPIVYIHRRDYGQPLEVVTIDGETGEVVEAEVTAAKNPVTGDPYNPKKFQLLSAGVDGRFGTKDDIGNFTEPKN